MSDPKLDDGEEGSLLGVFVAIPIALIALVIFAWALTGSPREPSMTELQANCRQPNVESPALPQAVRSEIPNFDSINAKKSCQDG